MLQICCMAWVLLRVPNLVCPGIQMSQMTASLTATVAPYNAALPMQAKCLPEPTFEQDCYELRK